MKSVGVAQHSGIDCLVLPEQLWLVGYRVFSAVATVHAISELGRSCSRVTARLSSADGIDTVGVFPLVFVIYFCVCLRFYCLEASMSSCSCGVYC